MGLFIASVYLLLAASHHSVSGALSADEIKRFNGECLAAHNALRALHVDTPAMTWSDSLAADSQNWAEELSKKGYMQHAENIYGENIYSAWWTGCGYKTCSEAVLSWYSEINDYDYNTHSSSNGKAVGHFTQIVWKASTQVGVGVSYGINSNGDADVYIVARYTPYGNYRGQYQENVQPRKPGSVTPTAAQLYSGSYSEQCGDCKDGNSACPGFQKWCTDPNSPTIAEICKKTCNLC